jgi:hypothetical protein
MISSLLLAAVLVSPNVLQAQLNEALDTGSLEPWFASKEAHDSFLTSASRSGGLEQFDAFVFPAPEGWGPRGEQWATLSAFQEIQQDHDPVYRVVDGKLGEEVPEWERGGYRITHAEIRVELSTFNHLVMADVTLSLDSEPGAGTLVARLNRPYRIQSAFADGQRVIAQKYGSLVIVPSDKPIKEIQFKYRGLIDTPGHDKITDQLVHLTAWWIPSIGRLPHTTHTIIDGPERWELRSEGEEVPWDGEVPSPPIRPGLMRVEYRCDLPISFPKVLGGNYTLAHEVQRGGRFYRSWQINPVDERRAKRDVEKMMEGMAFFEKHLTPFPFSGYEVFDADSYYGIESYSHTLLRRSVTTRFVNHELGHTWFGGIAPCAYSKDTWNEGATQYIDSVCLNKNSDRTLESGLRSINFRKPLSKMGVAWEGGNASYMRGAYVFNMLAAEIGQEKVYEGFRLLLLDRVGKETLWPDLKQYFEQSSGHDLDWFWDQWVENASFPRLSIVSSQQLKGGGRQVTIKQTGTNSPFRLKVGIQAGSREQVFEMTQAEQTFRIEATGSPKLVVFPYTLAHLD